MLLYQFQVLSVFVLITSLDGQTIPSQDELVARWLTRNYTLRMVNANGKTREQAITPEDINKLEICLDEYRMTTKGNDFDKLLNLYATCIIKFGFKLPLKWISIDGKHSELKHRKYRRFLPTMTGTPATYSIHETEAAKPTTVIVKWIHNTFAKDPLASVIKEEVTQEETTSFSETTSWSASVTVSTSIEVAWFSASAEFTVGGSGGKTQSKEVVNTKTYALEDSIGIDPNTSSKIIWTVFEQNLESSWAAFMVFSGYIPVAVQISGNFQIWFLPLSDMAKFISGFVERPNNPGSLYVPVEGLIRGKRGVKSVTRVFQFPLEPLTDTKELQGKCSPDLGEGQDYQDVLDPFF